MDGSSQKAAPSAVNWRAARKEGAHGGTRGSPC